MEDNEFESHIYSLFHHETSLPSINVGMPVFESPPVRICNSKNIINNADVNKQNAKRYFVQDQPSHNKSFVPKFNTPAANIEDNVVTEPAPTTVIAQKFVPYRSILSSFMPTEESIKEPEIKVPAVRTPNKSLSDKKKQQKIKPKKIMNPLNKINMVKLKNDQPAKVKKEKIKKKGPKKIASSIVVIDDTSGDSDNDDVIPVEVPAPVVISLVDSSDAESVASRNDFTFPKKVPHRQRVNRGISPSNSSVMSDDFIVLNDKSRLNDSFSQVPLEPETQYSLLTVDNVINRSLNESNSVRNKTLVDLNAQKPSSAESDSTELSSSESILKRTENSKKNSVKETRKSEDEDSIYGAKAKKTTSTRKRSLSMMQSESSEEENVVVISAKKSKMRRRKSEGSWKSDVEQENSLEVEPRHKLFTSTPTVSTDLNPKKRGIIAKRKFNSECYTDDEFANLLSNIVDEDNDEQDKEDSNELVINSEISHSRNLVTTTSSFSSSNSKTDECEVIDVDSSSNPPVVICERPSKQQHQRFKKPLYTDLSLNVVKNSFDVHEYIGNYNNSSTNESNNLAISQTDLEDNSEVGWNDEMRHFYNQSWGGENFYIGEVLNSMPRDISQWAIKSTDRYRMHDPAARMRCRNCNELGHLQAKCKKARKKVVCYICGNEGHRESRCTNIICLKCGEPSKVFVQGCTNCNKLSKKTCLICKTKGHCADTCPDLWRRYHSTVTDTGILNSEITYNKDRIYCSICSKRGHWANSCQSYNKVISATSIPGCIRITSHQPAYPPLSNSEMNKRNDHIFNLISYLPNYEFKFGWENVSKNSCLSGFRETFTANLANAQASVKQPKLKRPKRSKDKKANNSSLQLQSISSTTQPSTSFSFSEEIKKIKFNLQPCESFVITLNTSTADRSVTSSINQSAVVKSSLNEDSNYSFTEFFDDKLNPDVPPLSDSTKLVPTSEYVNNLTIPDSINITGSSVENFSLNGFNSNPFAEKLPDFISLESVEDQNQDAKVMLTKNHVKILECDAGKLFLEQAKKGLQLIMEFSEDSFGMNLTLKGSNLCQTKFHVQLKDYLYKVEMSEYEKQCEQSRMVPKDKDRVIMVIRNNLKMLHKSFGPVVQIHAAMLDADRLYDFKRAIKCRRSLNIILMGCGGLAQGSVHLEALRSILADLKRESNVEKVVSKRIRDDIMEHTRYIFSAIKHDDYSGLIDQFLKNKASRESAVKLVPNPVAFNRVIPIQQLPQSQRWENNENFVVPKNNQILFQQNVKNQAKRNGSAAKYIEQFHRMLCDVHPHIYNKRTNEMYRLLDAAKSQLQSGFVQPKMLKKLQIAVKRMQTSNIYNM